MNEIEQQPTYCMRCAAPFPGGGPGVTFCNSCIAEMQKENGYDKQNEQDVQIPKQTNQQI